MSSVKINTTGQVGRRDVFLLEPADIVVGKNPARWHNFEEEHVERLVGLFERDGQETEVTIRKIHDNKVALVAGFNRHEAAVRFNQRHPDAPMQLRCRMVTCNEEDAHRRSISENEGRMSTSVIDQAHAQNALRERYNWSDDRIVELYCCSKTNVNMLKRLVMLPYETQMLVHTGKLTMQAALSLTTLPTETQAEIIGEASAQNSEPSSEPTPTTEPDSQETIQPTKLTPIAPTEPTKTFSQRVVAGVRDKKIAAGGAQRRTLSEITSFWRHIETDSTLVQSLAGLVIQFHDGSITETKFQETMEALV